MNPLVESHRRHLVALVVAGFFAGCGARPSTPAATATSATVEGAAKRAGASVPLIPRALFFGNPDKTSVRISPDGAHLAYLAPVDGVLNIWVANLNDLASARAITQDKKRGIRRYFWAFSNRHIVYLQDKGGDENWRVYSVDIESGAERSLTPFDGVKAQIEAVSHRWPNTILVGLNRRDAKAHDLFKLDISTGQLEEVQRNDSGYTEFVVDESYAVKLAVRLTADGGSEFLKKAGRSFEPFIKISAEDAMTTAPRGFDASGNTLYLADSRDRNTAALAAIDMTTGQRQILATDDRADVGRVLLHPTERTVQAIEFTYERQTWQFFDDAVKADFAGLAGLTRGDPLIVSRTLDDTRWIVAFDRDDGPVRYYRYDRASQKAEFLFSNRAALEPLSLTRMYPAIIKSRDGLDLVSYYSLPSWQDQNGKPPQALPMVLFVHGGPWGRDQWGYHSYHQWLSNRGYAVMSVNFRGSRGFGKTFLNAGNLEWSGKMHDDLLDAVTWAVDQGIADRDKIAIMGGSYGGYATLVGMTFTPKRFACGVDIVGPSNLVTLLSTIPPYWAPLVEMFKVRVGDLSTDEGRARLERQSPLSRVGAIERPLLIGQGANDPRVKQSESHQIVEAMQAKNIPVTYVLFPDEGHGFARPENRSAFNAVAEVFLHGCLGGRYEAIGDDFEGSSVKVPAGAAEIPGVDAALVDKKSPTP